MERAPFRKLKRPVGLISTIFLMALLLFFVACHQKEKSFSSLLLTIDSSPSAVSSESFMQAASLANGTEEQLRLLKRASKLSPELYANIASEILINGNVTEPVALTILDAFLSVNMFSEALLLFQGALESTVWPSEYAETITLSFRNGIIPVMTIEQLVACADITGDTRFLVYAAVQSMKDGDKATARTLLIDSQRSPEQFQYSTSYILLWDAGALNLISVLKTDPSDPQELAVYADAEYLLGNIASACVSWAYLIDRFPTWSWKPYVALARIIAPEASQETQDWPHAAALDSWIATSSPSEVEAQLYLKTERIFSDSSDASLERAHWLYSKNQLEEARNLISTLSGESAAIARLEYGLPELAVSDALRSVAEYPFSARIYDAALGTLAKSGAWDHFKEIAKKCHVEEMQTRRVWFWDSLVLVLEGDVQNAAEKIRNFGAEQYGYAGSVNLGILELAINRTNFAIDAFMIAVGLAHDTREKAIAYIWAGDSLQIAKLPDKAALAYEAALGANPGSREARSRLMRLKLHH